MKNAESMNSEENEVANVNSLMAIIIIIIIIIMTTMMMMGTMMMAMMIMMIRSDVKRIVLTG